MRTPQLCSALLALAFVASACSRADTDANAQRAKEQMKTAAARAGEQLADSWLTTKIQAQYFADDNVKARHINVSTRDGVVTLTGIVDGASEREEAVQIAKNTDGVKSVTDRMVQTAPSSESGAVATSGATAPPSAPAPASVMPPPSDDAQVTARVQSKFFTDDRVKGRRIEVSTQNGIVTLAGEVSSEDERGQALLLARTTDGVQRVEDHLTVNVPSAAVSAPAAARMDDAMVATTIQAKYFVDPAVKDSAIDVSVKDGVVLLEGSVSADSARQQALAIARDTEGVAQVVDRLSVAKKRR